FSPRALAAARSRTVTRRFALPPNRGSAVRAFVAAASELLLCEFIWILHVSWRRGGVPGRFDHRTPRARGTGGPAARRTGARRRGAQAHGGADTGGGGSARVATVARPPPAGGNVLRYGVVSYR